MPGYITTINGGEHTTQQVLEWNRKGLEAGVTYWHKNIAPLHFENEAYQRYGYQKRKGQGEPPYVPSDSKDPRYAKRLRQNRKYWWAKFRKKKHTLPLVYTGMSKRMILRGIRLSFRRRKGSDSFASASGAMDAPKHFYQYNKSVNAPDKYAELIRVIPSEEATLLQIVNATIGFEMRRTPPVYRRFRVK
jgi:hypothetical protein